MDYKSWNKNLSIHQISYIQMVGLSLGKNSKGNLSKIFAPMENNPVEVEAQIQRFATNPFVEMPTCQLGPGGAGVHCFQL